MNREDVQEILRLPYDRNRWLALLREVLPSTEVLQTAQQVPSTNTQVRSIQQVARIPLAGGRNVAVLEVEVSGKVDLRRNRVGVRDVVRRFIDQQQAHAVLGLFRGEEVDYRFSFVARTSEIAPDGELSRSETEPRRYTYMLGPGQACRTPVERLDAVSGRGRDATLEDLLAAFKVEPLFKEFFSDYRRVFEHVEMLIRPTLPDKDALRLFTQRLFNRLMFLAFIARKGWMRLGERTDYLAALRDAYSRRRSAGKSFYRDHLVPLFFEGLNRPDRPPGEADPRFGVVPYLNGGLFEKAEDGSDDRAGIVVPDEGVEAILSELFARYNFTVAESTPLDVEVAVDPEMLGKVFEELVTGRHEQGSYYTPKPIVSFMCREALVEYLVDRRPRETRSSIEAFVHEHRANSLRDAEGVFADLSRVTVCDPACGSGAYLLGMLHELLDLRTSLFSTNRGPEAETSHARKLEIIERNLYGVDKDAFAVNIARLRLWLSLAVEFEGEAPPALPNLDFKIERGDALTGRDPETVFADIQGVTGVTVQKLHARKADYLGAHGDKKALLLREIDGLKASLKSWLATEGPADAFHWAVEFAEIFLPESAVQGAVSGGSHGFDIVVANPPYVRMELIKPLKPILRRNFPHVHAERADLYVYFYARAHQLLRAGGVAAFISSNKWLRAGYGEPLRRHLLDEQAFKLVMDFGDQPVFEETTAYPCVFLWKKAPREEMSTRWATVKDLAACYMEGVRSHFARLAVAVPSTQFGKDKPRLASSAAANLRARMERSGPSLGELCRGVLAWGVKTGLNDAFFIDQDMRDQLIRASSAAAEIIKPLLVGDDVRRYELHYRGAYLIYAHHGVDIQRYPSIKRYLQPFRKKLEARATQQQWFELQQPQEAYVPIFEGPKITYPIISRSLRFCRDDAAYYHNDKAFSLPIADWYVLGVLNSQAVWAWVQDTLSPLRGGFYEFRAQYMEKLPIPDATSSQRVMICELTQRAQDLHVKRRSRVERFLRDLGIDPAESTSRNPLEQPWMLSASEYGERAPRKPARFHEEARDETAALTEQIARLEGEIDARVAALYGLDSEDQRWAAKAGHSTKPDDKQALFFRVLGGLKDRNPYFTFKAIQQEANQEELALKDSSLKVYLNEALKQGIVHDAGRGWYSRLGEPARLDPKPVSRLIHAVEKAFPLMDFSVWSTAQLNPWMQHLIAQPVAFLNAPSDALESVGEFLRHQGWEPVVNPTPKEAPKAVRPGERTVVLRPTHSKEPSGQGRQAAVEKVLVDLVHEVESARLMDPAEAQGVASGVANANLIGIASMKRYAEFRGVKFVLFSEINHRQIPTKGGGS